MNTRDKLYEVYTHYFNEEDTQQIDNEHPRVVQIEDKKYLLDEKLFEYTLAGESGTKVAHIYGFSKKMSDYLYNRVAEDIGNLPQYKDVAKEERFKTLCENVDGVVIPSTLTLDGTKYAVTDVYSLSITPKYLKKTEGSIFGLIKFGSNVNKIGDMCKCGTAVKNPVTVDLSDANITEIPNDCFNRACIKLILGSKVHEIGKQAFLFLTHTWN